MKENVWIVHVHSELIGMLVFMALRAIKTNIPVQFYYFICFIHINHMK